MRFAPYFIARSNAIELDRQGVRPGWFIKTVVLGPLAIITLGVAYLVLRVLAAILFNTP